MSINDDIQRANLERIKSIEYMFIEKSITDDIQYGVKVNSSESSNVGSGILISKTGEEIKSKLSIESDRISTIKNEDYLKMSTFVKFIGDAPIKENDSYRAQDWKGRIQIPFTYCYSQIYDEASRSDVPNAKQMREYNQLARDSVNKSIEELKLKTIINAIDKKKKYKLTVDIASKLGF